MKLIDNFWTSSFELSLPDVADESTILGIVNEVIEEYSNNRNNLVLPTDDLDSNEREYIEQHAKYSGSNSDFTGCMKGLVMSKIMKELILKYNVDHCYINFGGDILAYNVPPTEIKIDSTNFKLLLHGTFAVFTSGNTNKRGNHIMTSSGYMRTDSFNVTYTKLDKNGVMTKGAYLDMKSTVDYAESNHRDNILEFASGILQNNSYIASPFFCKYDIGVRDAMLGKVANYFRPDRTEASKNYDATNPDPELIGEIFTENITNIDKNQVLVFPQYTKDLGTLIEVGYAMQRCKWIARYDYLTNTYTISNIMIKEISDPEVIDFSTKPVIKAIQIGYLYAQDGKRRDYVLPDGMHNNIMLSDKIGNQVGGTSNEIR